MLKNKRQNYHNSRLPKIGSIVTVNINYSKYYRLRKFIVISFPLTDSPSRHSIGIHTCVIAALDNRNETHRVAGHLCETIE